MSTFNIDHIMTTAYHQQANGMVERLHRRLKDACRARDAVSSWAQELPLILLSLRVAPRDDTGISPAEHVYGSTLSLPSSFVDARPPPSTDFITRLRMAMAAVPVVPTNTAATSPSWVDDALETCTHVWVRRDGHVKPLDALYDGPFVVLERSDKVFKLQIGLKPVTVSIDRLKPVHSELPIVPMQPRRRGRPPRVPAVAPPTTTTSGRKKKRRQPPSSQTTVEPAVLGGGCADHPAIRHYNLRKR